MFTQVTTALQDTIRKLYQSDDIELNLERPDAQFGDLTTNVAMQLAKIAGAPPRQIAEAIAAELRQSDNAKEWLDSVDIAGPGFINISLHNEYLVSLMHAERPKPYAGKTLVIETNNPNPFKDIHIGHAMNSIVSDTVANLLEAGGAEVHRVSYHGDVGLHVAKSLWAILQEYPTDTVNSLSRLPEQERPQRLREWYAAGAKAYTEDETAKQAIEDLTKQTFHFTDTDIAAVHALCKGWSFAYFDTVFARLGCKPVERRYLESETDEKGRAIVEAHIGDVFEHSNGAVVFPGEKYGLHTRVFISSRGTTLYEARDLGLMILKDEDFKPDASYIITAEEQANYFKVVILAAAMADPDMQGKTINMSTGTVKLSTGKMSSRTGDVVNISWLTEQLEQAVKEVSQSDAEIDDIVRAALRVSFLKNRLTSDIVFDIKTAVSIEGNTGPYLLYAYARAKSIIRKSSAEIPPFEELAVLEPDERQIVSKIVEYNFALEKAISERMPHHIMTYLFELTREFNSFYEKNRVIGDAREAIRIGLLNEYTAVLRDGMNLLGIKALEQM